MDTKQVAQDWFRAWAKQIKAFDVRPSIHCGQGCWFIWDQYEYPLAQNADLVTCCEMALAKLQSEKALKTEVQALCSQVARLKGWDDPGGKIYWAEGGHCWSSASHRKIGNSLSEAKAWLEGQLK